MTTDSTTTRVLDAGGPLFLHEQPPYDPMPPCGRGVCVEMPAAIAATDQPFVVSLRHFERHDGGQAIVDQARFDLSVSLATGECTPRRGDAERALTLHPWIADALASQVQHLRDRARRLLAQRDRSSYSDALGRAAPGMMVPYDKLFPHDWDPIFVHDGRYYWATDQHCPNATCSCREILVTFYELSNAPAQSVGAVRINLQSQKPRPDPSSPAAAALFQPLWARFGTELTRRHHEVRQAVVEYAASGRHTARTTRPARNAPCPCGSGKKLKRCCALLRQAFTSR